MSKLDELGGIDKVRGGLAFIRKYEYQPDLDTSISIIEALIERVKELEQQNARIEQEHEHDHRWNSELLRQLKSLRELAEMVLMNIPWDSIEYTQAITAKAREILEPKGLGTELRTRALAYAVGESLMKSHLRAICFAFYIVLSLFLSPLYWLIRDKTFSEAWKEQWRFGKKMLLRK